MISGETIGQDEDIGQCPSYRDPLNLTFGCKHYRRNCKLLAPCCKKLYTCIRCHDELTDHSMDRCEWISPNCIAFCIYGCYLTYILLHQTCRKAITKMMCMKCLTIQPIGPKCSKLSCNNFSMAKYYCRICKLFDDERWDIQNDQLQVDIFMWIVMFFLLCFGWNCDGWYEILGINSFFKDNFYSSKLVDSFKYWIYIY